MYNILYYFHAGIGFFLALYALLALWWDFQLKSSDPREEESQKKAKLFYYFNRTATWLAVIAFLLGGKMGTPYFKAGHIWIFAKVVLWLALMGVLSALGAKGLKLYRKIPQVEEEEVEELQKRAGKKLTIFKWTYLATVTLLFVFAYTNKI